MKTKDINFTRKTAFGTVAIPMFGASVVGELFSKTEKNQPSLTLLLPFCLALASHSVSAAETGIDGASRTAPVTVNNVVPLGGITPYENLFATTTVTIPVGSTYECAVTCSSTIENTKDPFFSQNSSYGIGTSPTVAASGSIRRFSFPNDDPGIDDEDTAEVSSTFLFSATGTVSFYCLAAKDTAAQQDFVVANTSQTVICSDISF